MLLAEETTLAGLTLTIVMSMHALTLLLLRMNVSRNPEDTLLGVRERLLGAAVVIAALGFVIILSTAEPTHTRLFLAGIVLLPIPGVIHIAGFNRRENSVSKAKSRTNWAVLLSASALLLSSSLITTGLFMRGEPWFGSWTLTSLFAVPLVGVPWLFFITDRFKLAAGLS